MKIAIQPVSLFVPGKGSVQANLLEVRCSSYQLGIGASAFYDLQRRTIIPATEGTPAVMNDAGTEVLVPAVPGEPERTNDESLGMNGNIDLTAEQFAAWGKDDDWFTRCVAQNLGLFPITSA